MTTPFHITQLDATHMRSEISRSRAETFAAVARGIMFLFLGIAALIFSAPASAEQIGYIPNQAGGRIYLTDAPSTSPACADTLIAYATTAGGALTFGCWILDGDLVIVRWPDGDVSAFPVSDFLLPDHKAASPTGLRYDL